MPTKWRWSSFAPLFLTALVISNICLLAKSVLYYAKRQYKESAMPQLQLIEKTAHQPTVPEISDAESEAMARAVVNLFTKWSLSDAQATILLGGLSPRTWARWKTGSVGRVPRDLKARLSNLMGIHKALRIIFTDAKRGYKWISQNNDTFGGTSALDIMLAGELTDIMRVRRYLDSVRGG
jgi:hypothetical protein